MNGYEQYDFDYESDWVPYGTGQMYTNATAAHNKINRDFANAFATWCVSLDFALGVETRIASGAVSTSAEYQYAAVRVGPGAYIGIQATPGGIFIYCGYNLDTGTVSTAGAMHADKTEDGITYRKVDGKVRIYKSPYIITARTFSGSRVVWNDYPEDFLFKFIKLHNVETSVINLTDWYCFRASVMNLYRDSTIAYLSAGVKLNDTHFRVVRALQRTGTHELVGETDALRIGYGFIQRAKYSINGIIYQCQYASNIGLFIPAPE